MCVCVCVYVPVCVFNHSMDMQTSPLHVTLANTAVTFQTIKTKIQNTHVAGRGGLMSSPSPFPAGEEGSIVKIGSSMFDDEFRIPEPGEKNKFIYKVKNSCFL